MYGCRNEGCPETFKFRAQRDRHVAKCTFPPSEPKEKVISGFLKCDTGGYRCQKCSKVLKLRNSIYKHSEMNCKTKEVTDFSCTVCNKTFRYRSKLVEHVSRTHREGRENYQCTNCNQSFKKVDRYKSHIKACFLPSMTANIVIQDNHHGDNKNDHSSSDASGTSDANPSCSSNDNENEIYTTIRNHAMPSMDNAENEIDDTDESDVDGEMNNGECLDTDVDMLVIEVSTIELIDNGKVLRDTPRKLNRKRVQNHRKKFALNDILKNVEEKERLAILNSSILSFQETPSTTPDINFSNAVSTYIKKLINNARRTTKSKGEASKFLLKVFRNHFEDKSFRLWFVEKFNLKGDEELESILTFQDTSSTTKLLPKEVRQDVYNFWKQNSQVSTCRSNDRHIVNILKKNINIQSADLHDEDIELNSERINQVKAHRKFTCESYEELYRIYSGTSICKISLSTFVSLKPFYIGPVTDREKESCLCIDCLNPHCIYNAIKHLLNKHNLRKLPRSLTEYLCQNMVCLRDEKINTHDLVCIEGKCANSCKMTNLHNDLKTEMKRMRKNVVSYYTFSIQRKTYFNSSGKESFYTRTTRVDNEGTLSELVDKLEKLKAAYLEHRFSVNNEEYYWKHFQENCNRLTVWMDYSMNIDLTEKRQAQSAHYSGAQQTCHCTIIKGNNSFVRYVYHLSDDTNHDSLMTFTIIRDIIQKYPEVVRDDFLVLHSDNAPSQYKSRHVFFKMRELAMEKNLTICWFYGERGHGKGTVDAMSSFGCKTPIRQEIISKDAWFDNAAKMVAFLNDRFKNDESKNHYFIDEKLTAEERRKTKGEHVIKDCRQKHLIAVNPKGEFFTMVHYQDQDYVLNLRFFEGDCTEITMEDKDENEEESEDEEDNDSNDAIDENNELTDHCNYLYEVIEPGTFVAMRCPSNSLELFFVGEVLSKDMALIDKMDANGHCVLKGEKFIEVQYLEKEHEGKHYVEYKRSNQPSSFIHLAEVFACHVELNLNLKMKQSEYQSLTLEAL